MLSLLVAGVVGAVFVVSGTLGAGAAGAQGDTTLLPDPTTAPSTEAPATTGDATTTTPGSTSTTSRAATTTAPVTTVAPPTSVPPDESADDPAAPGESPTTTLPTEPPEGFTEEQFRTFVGVVTACGPDPGVVCSRVLAWTDNRVLAEGAQWLTEVPVRILLIVGLALLANWAVRRAIARYVTRLDRRAALRNEGDRVASERRTLRMTTASTTLASAASVVIFVVAIVVALAQIDISLGPLLAGAGIVGVALGFGAQNVVRDVLAGFFVLVEDQYGIGDVIDVGRASGVVEGISLRVTKLRDVEGTLWFVPNGLVNEVGNLTQRWARVILDVGIAYGSDHHEAERLIKEAADSLWNDEDSELTVLEEPEMWGIELLGDSSVTIRIAVKCVPDDQWAVARALRSRIKDHLDDAGIEIPFPQQSVWVRSDGERQTV
ncbi:MAG: mechanosensitive ion channel family protein [Microthrixaceae bacterium]